MAKEERDNKPNDPKSKAPVDDIELGDPGAEKARMLQNEGATRGDQNAQETDSETNPSARASSEEYVTATVFPTSDNPYESQISEKARGKLRERRSPSIDTLGPLDHVPLNIGRNGFVPTQEWVTSWQQGYVSSPFEHIHTCMIHQLIIYLFFRSRLPLDPVMVFISEVVQRVEDMQRHSTIPTPQVFRFLSSINLDHVLPSKPPMTTRRFLVS